MPTHKFEDTLQRFKNDIPSRAFRSADVLRLVNKTAHRADKVFILTATAFSLMDDVRDLDALATVLPEQKKHVLALPEANRIEETLVIAASTLGFGAISSYQPIGVLPRQPFRWNAKLSLWNDCVTAMTQRANRVNAARSLIAFSGDAPWIRGQGLDVLIKETTKMLPGDEKAELLWAQAFADPQNPQSREIHRRLAPTPRQR